MADVFRLMAIGDELHNETIQVAVFGQTLNIEVHLSCSYITVVSFTFGRVPYTHRFSAWSGQGQARFHELFHETQRSRDRAQFGFPSGLGFSLDEKKNMVVQAVKDVFVCLDKIIAHYQASIVNYALHYVEHEKRDNTYSDYITLQACQMIIETKLWMPEKPTNIIRFD
jgi:hypothetical protein